MNKNKDILELLSKYNQEHIINLLNNIDEPKKQELIKQINNIDFQQLTELYQNTRKNRKK